MGGQVAKNVSFFMDTENANLGKAPKALGTGFQLLDAYGSWDIAPEFAIQGGLILIPLCRDCNSSAAALLGLDYGLWSFQESAPTQSSIGRDTGFQLKGLLLDKHLEYRIGAYSGFRQTNAKNSFRYAGRLQYNVFDVEVAQFYTTQYFATKKILAIGAGFDTQSSYNSFAGDIMLNLPVGKKNAFTFQGDFIRYDGSTFFTAAGIRKQNVFFAEAGFYICELKLEPFAVYQQQEYLNSPDKVLNKRSYQAGLGFYPFGNNLNFKLAWTYREFPNDPEYPQAPASSPCRCRSSTSDISARRFRFSRHIIKEDSWRRKRSLIAGSWSSRRWSCSCASASSMPTASSGAP